MFWADEIAARAAELAEASGSGPTHVINDSKTPSGTVHVGSLRGPVIHDEIHRALRRAGHQATFRYGVDDLDPMDSQALLTPDAVDRYMGVPLAHVPAPPGSDAPSYARHFVGELFLGTFELLGIHPEIYWMSEVYAAGDMDRFIRAALDGGETIRTIYREVSHVDKEAGWLPLSVICSTCGRVGTTIATDWDGETVAFECRPDLVTWATGCGTSGRTSPFGGAAKLPFNVDWAAKWSLFGITIEGCGKDLATAGGSRDRSDAIARQVFGREPPLNIPHEFINVGGRKMSTSRGRGVPAHEIARVIPPDELRLLFVRHRPNVAFDFDPDQTDAIPRQVDEFDRLAAATAGRPLRGELPADAERIFAASLVDPGADVAEEAAAFRPAFAHLALLAQLPDVDLPDRAAAEKGEELTERELAILDTRTRAVRAWLDAYAPPEARIEVHRDSVPDVARDLSSEQRAFLAALAGVLDGLAATEWAGEALQAGVFSTAKERGIGAGAGFAALYAAFLGRSSGPRAGWLLASLDRSFVIERLRAAGEA
ncbi:MAG TPA: lysine--tRNA ligase [Candidatus Limnocylindria bacterium]|nr:lysine--tRNA ligase [Candidatus Limnocylindria bacterium]